MKSIIKVILFFVTLTWAEATTVLRVEGMIEEQLEGDWPEVGTPFELNINYDKSKGPTLLSATSIGYTIYEHSLLILGGVDYPLQLTPLNLILGSDGVERVSFSPQTELFGPEEVSFSVGVSFIGSDGFVDDPRRLPGSLDEWKLDEVDFVFHFDFEDENSRFLARSTSYSHLSITTIPEPSSLAIVSLGIIPPVLRRRREGSNHGQCP
jgi:hypothetical protein